MALNASQIPAGDLAELQTLRDQYEQSVGYQIQISDDQLAQLSFQHVTDLTEFGQAVSYNGWMGSWHDLLPWATLGMSQNQYVATHTQYATAWANLTGQLGSPDSAPYFTWGLANGLSASEIAQVWQTNAQVQAAYPWIKYDMNYQQFQAQKQTMTQAFGRQLSDQEAAQQLQYFHSNAGTNLSVSAEPTFTQVEKKAANTGTPGPGTVVR